MFLCIVAPLLLMMQPIAGHAAAPSKPETESQQVLRRVMEAIRHCDKSRSYEYAPDTGQINPPELKKLKGLEFVRHEHGMAIFRVDEMYEGLHAEFLWMATSNSWATGMFSVAFRGSFQDVRQRLETIWNVQFEDKVRPGPDVIQDMQYADIEMHVDGKWRVLSIEKALPEEMPPIIWPEVGCNTF